MKKFLLASTALFAICTGVATASALVDTAPAKFSAGQSLAQQVADNSGGGSDDGADHDSSDDKGGSSSSGDDGDDDSSEDDNGSSPGVSGCDSAQDQAEKAECKG